MGKDASPARGSTEPELPEDWAEDPGDHGALDKELRAHRVLEGDIAWSGDFERDELAARAHRLRKIIAWAVLAWLLFLPTDLTFNTMRGADDGPAFVVARLLALIPLALVWLGLGRRRSPSRVVLFSVEVLCLSSIAGATAYMAVLSGGLASPMLAALPVILIFRALAIPDPWRRSLPLVAAPALVFWLVIGVEAALGPGLPEIEPELLATLVLHVGLVLVTITTITVGSHAAWDVRRNLYKARAVGRYELLRPLGRGAMGEVWVAWHQGLRQEVALKILPFAEDTSAVVRFEREVLATTKLRHPNTVRVYDFGLTPEGFWYYAMELLEGETLAELVAREGPLPIARAFALLRQATRALAEAHDQGIVHRDIKPENLFVATPAGERDVIKVLDFGVASVAAEAGLQDIGPTEPVRVAGADSVERDPTDPGFGDPGFDDPGFDDPGFDDPRVGDSVEREVSPERAVGTPLYISPEAAIGQPSDRRSDIYALGCVLYFTLTGRPPFVERDVRSLLRAHVHTQPTPPSTLLASALPDYVEKLIMRCLAKEPERRYADADALVQAIDLCVRLGDNDRRRGAGEALQPRVRASQQAVEEWAKHSGTETDMSLIGTKELD